MENQSTLRNLTILALVGTYIWWVYRNDKRAKEAHESYMDYQKWALEKDFPEKSKKPGLKIVETELEPS